MESDIKPPARTASAIVTNLAAPYDAMVEALWGEFRQDCGIVMQQAAHPVAHLSWQGAASYDLPKLYEILTGIVKETAPFNVQMAGVGLFTYPAPVVYLAVAKARQVLQLHRQIWEKAAASGTDLNRFYAPSSWIPHITLAYHVHDPETLKCTLRKLVFCRFDWEVRVDHLALLHSGGDSLLIKGEQFLLRGGA